MLSAIASVGIQTVSCIGLGSFILRVLNAGINQGYIERLAWTFGLGLGALGWLNFYLGLFGYLAAIPISLLLLIGVFGLYWFNYGIQPKLKASPNNILATWKWTALLTALLAVISLDIIEGLSPAADADTLAYHFHLPKIFLREELLFFVPRAADGAIPLLIHMTYIPVLALGGELALTLWVMVTGWFSALLLYCICRDHLSVNWSLAVILIFMTTPAFVYGAGNGQVEIKNTIFVMMTAKLIFLSFSNKQDVARYLFLAGVTAGFFAGAKFTGLLFTAAAGTVCLFRRKWFFAGSVFSLGAILTGSQWYLWNWIQSGDPFFPVLYGILPYTDPTYWSQDHHEQFGDLIFEAEHELARNFLSLLIYPVYGLLGLFENLDSGRVGFGPITLLLLPLAVMGSYLKRRELFSGPLMVYAVIGFIFYILWFYTGFSQRLRHVVPLYPLILLSVFVAAHYWSKSKKLVTSLAVIVLITSAVQFGGLAIFSTKFVKHSLSGFDREVFLNDQVWAYEPVPWINQNLKPSDKVLLWQRWLNFLIDVPVFYAQVYGEARINTLHNKINLSRFVAQMREQGVTHLLVQDPPQSSLEDRSKFGTDMWRPLLKSGCLTLQKTFVTNMHTSRSVPGLGGAIGKSHLLVLNTYTHCPG